MVASSMRVTNSGVSSSSLKKPASSEEIGENEREDSCIVASKKPLHLFDTLCIEYYYYNSWPVRMLVSSPYSGGNDYIP